MFKNRKIIEIDEEKCNGCGQCVVVCAESALTLVDGKARLIRDVYCDGLGVCLGKCPTGALKIVERSAEAFDQAKTEAHIKAQEQPKSKSKPEPIISQPRMACGCPSSQAMSLKPGAPGVRCSEGVIRSELTHWPIKLQLLSPQAPFLKGADLLLMADCVGAALPDLHAKLLRGRAVAIGCPKLDDLDAHIQRLSEILAAAAVKSLMVAHMEVPCCHGFMHAAQAAIRQAGVDVPLSRIIIGRNGEILDRG